MVKRAEGPVHDMRRNRRKNKYKTADKIFLKLLYAICFVGIVAGAVYVYVMWYERYSAARPALVQAEGSFYIDETPLKAVLLWNEKVIYSPKEGKVFYPKGVEPFFAGENETLAVIELNSGSKVQIKAREPGYFVAGIDGYEGKWSYINLWNQPGVSVEKKLRLMRNGTIVSKGSPIGKLIPQPQHLRAIVYWGHFPLLNELVREGHINIKTNKGGFMFNADVEAISQTGSLSKVYLALPFFPLEYLYSRETNILLCMGERRGVVIPESSVLMQNGKLWVYKVEGDEVIRHEIEGLPVGKGKFMVTNGLKPGEVVVKNASKAREGVIRLW